METPTNHRFFLPQLTNHAFLVRFSYPPCLRQALSDRISSLFGSESTSFPLLFSLSPFFLSDGLWRIETSARTGGFPGGPREQGRSLQLANSLLALFILSCLPVRQKEEELEGKIEIVMKTKRRAKNVFTDSGKFNPFFRRYPAVQEPGSLATRLESPPKN